mmetsp:Transcript_56161/g.93285  ORF Transcript_56161/g.93285 Transcript_56161/m.93285 type:complete len:248 (-) Transcript_56161:1366-2109(-)
MAAKRCVRQPLRPEPWDAPGDVPVLLKTPSSRPGSVHLRPEDGEEMRAGSAAKPWGCWTSTGLAVQEEEEEEAPSPKERKRLRCKGRGACQNQFASRQHCTCGGLFVDNWQQVAELSLPIKRRSGPVANFRIMSLSSPMGRVQAIPSPLPPPAPRKDSVPRGVHSKRVKGLPEGPKLQEVANPCKRQKSGLLILGIGPNPMHIRPLHSGSHKAEFENSLYLRQPIFTVHPTRTWALGWAEGQGTCKG